MIQLPQAKVHAAANRGRRKMRAALLYPALSVVLLTPLVAAGDEPLTKIDKLLLPRLTATDYETARKERVKVTVSRAPEFRMRENTEARLNPGTTFRDHVRKFLEMEELFSFTRRPRTITHLNRKSGRGVPLAEIRKALRNPVSYARETLAKRKKKGRPASE